MTEQTNLNLTWRRRIANWLLGPQQAATITAEVDDSPGWTGFTGRPHDYDQGKIQELYSDSLEAWRKNPFAWRIIAITTDYIVGDHFKVDSDMANLQRFIYRFWNHPKNNLDLRLDVMSDELSRAGDLFVALFRNDQDGMSYIRFVTKDRIVKIETASNDWEKEIAYYEVNPGGEPRKWLHPDNPAAPEADQVMLHYSVNKPMGALLGEGDLTTMIPWLQRYSRMLEDRVRLHWALRAFLWIVKVPTNRVKEKQEQYRRPPESGSIIVHDEGEEWKAVTPTVEGADAGHDMMAVRQMIDAGSGFPPHWRGEPGEANLATATAMQAPTERHLLRRQKYFAYMLQDILYYAYQRAVEIGKARRLRDRDYSDLFTVTAPDVSRSDNEMLARAAKDIALAMSHIKRGLRGESDTFDKLSLRLALRFAGEPQTDETLETIMREMDGPNGN